MPLLNGDIICPKWISEAAQARGRIELPLLLAIRATLRPDCQATNQVKAVVLIPARLPGQYLGAEHGNVLSKEEGDEYYRCPALHLSLTPLANCCFNSVTSQDTQRLVLVTQGTLWVLHAGFQAVTISSRSPCATLQDARTVGQERATLCTWKQRAFLPLPAFKAAPTFQWFYWKVLLQLVSTQLREFVASALKTSHLRNVWLGH